MGSAVSLILMSVTKRTWVGWVVVFLNRVMPKNSRKPKPGSNPLPSFVAEIIQIYLATPLLIHESNIS